MECDLCATVGATMEPLLKTQKAYFKPHTTIDGSKGFHKLLW